MHIESSPRSDLTQTTEECDLEDFGAKLERCKAKDSPGKNSPSKHKKLFGSLRSLRSLTNLHSSPTKTKAKQPMTLRSESPVRHLVRVDAHLHCLQCADSLGCVHDAAARVAFACHLELRAVPVGQAHIRPHNAPPLFVWLQPRGSPLVTDDSPRLS